jgi:hypothetical protein
MSRIWTFLLGMATGAILLHVGTLYHVVRATDGVHLIEKQPPRLGETYVDIRSYSMTDWAGHPQLASAIVQANQQQLLSTSAAASLSDTVGNALPAWPKP